MITSFDLRDVPLVRQLDGQGIPMDTEAALTLGVHLLRNALVSYLAMGERGLPTFVLRKGANGDRICALAQMRHRAGAERARILYIAPRLAPNEAVSGVWLGLLDHLTRVAGARGAQSLVAEVPIDSPAVETLRTAGFAVYTRQEVLRLDPPVGAKPDGTALEEGIDTGSTRLRPRRPEDMWSINLLYANTAPPLLQLAEPPPGSQDDAWRRGYVLEDKRRGDVLAYLQVKQGPVGLCLKAWLLPDAEDRAGELVAGALRLAQPVRPRPMYWLVSRYQGWLRGLLADSGFAEWASQAVMVKHTVARVGAEPARVLAGALETHPKLAVPVVKADRLPPQDPAHAANH